MDSKRFTEVLEKVLEATSSAEEQRELVALMEADVTWAERAFETALLHAVLQTGRHEPDVFVRRLRKRIEARRVGAIEGLKIREDGQSPDPPHDRVRAAGHAIEAPVSGVGAAESIAAMRVLSEGPRDKEGANTMIPANVQTAPRLTGIGAGPRQNGGAAVALAQPRAARGRRGGLSLNFGVSPKHLTQFTRQFATLLDAGLPVVRSLDILQRQCRVGFLRDTIAEVKEDVESGSSLSEALAKTPKVFDKLYVNMVKAGEAAGVLDQILCRLADYMEKNQRLKQKIIGALVYPAAVVMIAGGILTMIMIFIIPKFEAMFVEMELGDMPIMTTVLLQTANTIKQFWFLIVFLPLLIWLGLHLLGKTTSGRFILDLAKLKFPLFGMIIVRSAVSRFCRTLGTLLQSGVPILQALAIIKNATGNAVVASAVAQVHDSIREGDTIAEPLRHSGVFDDMVVNMIQVGEETGELDRMLIKVADTYDNEVDTLVGSLMSLLEPLLIIGMGGAVGFIVISLFMPLISIMNRIGGQP